MGSFLSVIPVVIRRVGANARLLAAVLVGAVLAAGLMSTTSTYTDAIRDLGLAFAIRQSGPDKTNILVRSSSQSSDESIYRKNEEFIETSLRQALGPVLRPPLTTVARSSTFFPTAPGGVVSEDDNRPRSHLQLVTNLEPRIRVTEGRLPAAAAPAPGGRAPAIEAAVGSETARQAGVKVGDRFDLHPFWKPEAEPVQLTLVGIVEPVDGAEPFWLGQTDLFYFPTRWQTLPFFVTEQTFFAVSSYLPTMSSDFFHLVYVNTTRIDARNAESVRGALVAAETLLASNLPRTSMATGLPDLIQTYAEKLFFTRIPLLVLVLQIAGIVLYYLFMVSTMLVERQAGEIALLKSRGATTAQVMQIYVVEGLIVFSVALAAGPPLAAVVISLLGQTPPFADLTQGANLSVRLTLDAYAWAAAGALLAFLTLLGPAYQATRSTVVQQRTSSSRPPKQAAFTRYYLDLVLVGAGAILFYQLNRRGSLVTERLFGEQSVDPIQLLTPAFFILTVGIAFLRLFPLALRLLAWAVARAPGVAVLIGMWQLVRNPVHYSRLVLLLMLATAVGMFAASFGATLDRSYADRAAYQSGAALRLMALRRLDAAGPDAIEQTLKEQYGAEAVSRAMRVSASQGQTFQRLGVDVLGIDPATFGAVGYFRDDFAAESLGSLLKTLAQDEPQGGELALPPDTSYLGVWFNPTDLRGRAALEAEVRDATGRYFSFTFGPDAGYELQPGWVYLVANLSLPMVSAPNLQLSQAPPQAPFQLTSLSIRFVARVSDRSGAFQIDDLQAGPVAPGPLGVSRLLADPERRFAGLPESRVVADFESVANWAPVQGVLPEALNDELRTVPSGTSGAAMELVWRPVRGQASTHGIHPAGNDKPLAVLASEGFLEQSGLKAGDQTQVFVSGSFIEIEVAGSFRLFPTLEDPRDTPAFLANANRLSSLINGNPRGPTTYADEAWLRPGPQTEARLREAVNTGRIGGQLISFQELRSAQQRDPLVAASWEGILFISFAAILLLSAVGFLIYSYLTAQRRMLEFAVLRTMGFSRRQIAAVVGFEQAFVVGLGMLAGTLFGLRLGGLMIRYMGVTETGDEVLPPMLLHVSWLTIGSAWLVLALAFLVTIGVVVLLYARLQLHRVLRIGEA